jgi:pyridoxamine 5'-phosphate oxidase
MSVATADATGQPSSRMVLLKDYGPDSFVFYTNVESAKGIQLTENPRAALLFHWKSLRRQVRIEGMAEAVSEGEADAYFASRARDSQLGAWASDQSRPMENRERFEQRFEELERRYAGQDVPRPPFWSGYRVVPDRIEFWTERPYRLHERRLFQRDGSGWTEELLYP